MKVARDDLYRLTDRAVSFFYFLFSREIKSITDKIHRDVQLGPGYQRPWGIAV